MHSSHSSCKSIHVFQNTPIRKIKFTFWIYIFCAILLHTLATLLDYGLFYLSLYSIYSMRHFAVKRNCCAMFACLMFLFQLTKVKQCEDRVGTVEFSAQMASNAENVSIWWRHHELAPCVAMCPISITLTTRFVIYLHFLWMILFLPALFPCEDTILKIMQDCVSTRQYSANEGWCRFKTFQMAS